MIRVFQPGDLVRLAQGPAESCLLPFFEDDTHGRALAMGTAYTLEVDGVVLGCAGLQETWANRYIAWAIMAKAIGRHMVQVHKATKRMLTATTIRRIEAHVDCNYAAGHRWVSMLGFVKEGGPMRAFTPDGRDCDLYARVK